MFLERIADEPMRLLSHPVFHRTRKMRTALVLRGGRQGRGAQREQEQTEQAAILHALSLLSVTVWADQARSPRSPLARLGTHPGEPASNWRTEMLPSLGSLPSPFLRDSVDRRRPVLYLARFRRHPSTPLCLP